MTTMSGLSPPASNKRSFEEESTQDSTPPKRRRLYHHHHTTRVKQPCAVDLAQHDQDSRLFDGQLARSVAVMLDLAGFDSISNNAFEEIVAYAQEYMLRFLSVVRQSMHSGRRITPLPADFVNALAATNATPAQLLQHVELKLPRYVWNQPIIGPNVETYESSDIETVLGNELSATNGQPQRGYIPKHLPALPSRHTWQHTPIYPEREIDPRKVREVAMEEGTLAEQALRKLASARKAGVARRKTTTVRGAEHIKAPARRQQPKIDRNATWEKALKVLQAEDSEERKRNEDSEDLRLAVQLGDGLGSTTFGNDDQTVRAGAGLLANYERKFWRQAARGGKTAAY